MSGNQRTGAITWLRSTAVRRELPALALLAGVVIVGLYLRITNNDYGLPFVYNMDEGSHFTSRAVGMFANGGDPGYLQNPSAFTYLVHLVLRFQFGGFNAFGELGSVAKQFSVDPTGIYETARTLAALICAVGIVACYYAARRLWGRREAIAAAAVLCFAFIPVAYSRVAVTDVGTLAAVTLAVYFSIRIYDRGKLRDYLLAGAMVGVAIGFKYTAGLVVLPLLLAAGLRLFGKAPSIESKPDAESTATPITKQLLFLGGGLLAVVALFALTTPYFFLDFDFAQRQLNGQADLATVTKLGQEGDVGPLYYLQTLTWGFGWLPIGASILGFVILVRRQMWVAVLLLLFPVALFIYLSLQARFFGRWFLPAYPVLAMLAGYGIARAADKVPNRRWWRQTAFALIAIAVIWVPFSADVRSMEVLGNTDTFSVARNFLAETEKPRLRVVIEPGVPARFYRLWRPRLKVASTRKQFVRGFIKDIRETRTEYVRQLEPSVIDKYRRYGFCYVVTMSLFRGRAVRDSKSAATPLAYYQRLERESDNLLSVSPYFADATPQEFNFDLSYNYYSPAYLRPGPEIQVYRLKNCTQQYGPAPRGIGSGGAE